MLHSWSGLCGWHDCTSLLQHIHFPYRVIETHQEVTQGPEDDKPSVAVQPASSQQADDRLTDKGACPSQEGQDHQSSHKGVSSSHEEQPSDSVLADATDSKQAEDETLIAVTAGDDMQTDALQS